MHTIHAQNVNDAYVAGLKLLYHEGVERESRAGIVVEYPTCVATVYEKPWERVLLDPVRDANPFFHLMESLWMLRGQRDVGTVVRYNKRMDDYSDDGEVFHGAYGHRWRNHFSQNYRVLDQLKIIIRRLATDPDDRRCVLQMWDASYDLNVNKVDIPCNTHVYFKIRDKLHMTVCCRSNDIIWGAYGANAVHFSMLHQYVADCLDVEMGPYIQISDSFHAYKDVFSVKVKGIRSPFGWKALDTYDNYNFTHTRFKIPRLLDASEPTFYESPFYKELIEPMAKAWEHWKNGEWQSACDTVSSQMLIEDWRHVCLQWLERRKPNE
jgi:thymidylate synthase